jgi:CAP12/Pycsar effector protein, TIR domain
MAVTRRIFVSMPADDWLTPQQNELKWGIVDEIKGLDYVPEIFTNPKGMVGLASGKVWSRHDADTIMRKCVGAAIIGLPRWEFSTSDGQTIKLPTEYCQYEGAVAYTLGLPMLVVGQKDILRRVVFDQSYGVYMRFFPPNADRSWLGTKDFRVTFDYWKNELDKRRDVFLGYSSSSKGTAQNLKRLLEKDLNVTVLDWKTDFSPSRFILQQIEEAAARCSAGIFLFTKDDPITNETQAYKAVPRDNVVFEAGYFIHAKGKEHVLIVLENGAKMPADLGGDIYAPLDDKSDIEPIEETVRKFVGAL